MCQNAHAMGDGANLPTVAGRRERNGMCLSARMRHLGTALSITLLVACGGATGLDFDESGANSRPGKGAVPGPTSATTSSSSSPPRPPTTSPPTPTPVPSPVPTSPKPLPPLKCSLKVDPSRKFANLDDGELVALCEFLACSRGGYGSREVSCPQGTRRIEMPDSLEACVEMERSASLSAGSTCALTAGMLDACYGPWGEDLCTQPLACKAIDAVAITCN